MLSIPSYTNLKEERFLFNLNKNMKQENVHIKFCKFSLSVGKRTTNIVVLGELGRYPLLSLYKLKLFLNLNNAFNPLLYKSSLASAELPLELRYTPKYLYPFCSFNRYIIYNTVKPVLLYGSEVWVTSMVNKINKEERFLFNLSKNMKQENVHIKFIKYN
jgi:hypothetical protein